MSITPKYQFSDPITSSSIWKILTTYIPEYDNITPVELLLKFNQKNYEWFTNVTHHFDGHTRASLEQEDYFPNILKGRRVVNVTPRKFTERISPVLDYYLLYVDKRAEVEIAIESNKERKKRVTNNQIESVNDYLTLSQWYLVDLPAAHQELITLTGGKRKYANRRQSTYEDIFEWEKEVYNYLFNHPNPIDVTVADQILAISEELTARVYTSNRTEDYVVTPTVKLTFDTAKKALARVFKKTSLPLNYKGPLSSKTYAVYLTLNKNLDKVDEILTLLTPEEQHTIETMKNSILPEGINNLKKAKLLKNGKVKEIESQYVEILRNCNQKVITILERLKDSVDSESRTYYSNSKKILSLQ